ncbi:MAG TPA: alpha/beta fold hydrolase [Terriglobales bacterium]|nr:alpha/beta fold hydrolase [Terriglobales bacterium]
MSASFEPFVNAKLDPPVRGFLHRAENPAGVGLVLVHGAGSSGQAPLLVALAAKLSARGLTVLRCDLPYRQLRPYGPPRPGDAARDRQGIEHALRSLGSMLAGALFLGGHSYGGRQSTMLCAEKPELVNGMLLLSYPVHPPGKAEQLRVQHWPKLRAPSLFVHGTRDPFGTVAEMENALKLIPVRTQLLAVAGAGHDLNARKGQAAGESVVNSIVSGFEAFFALG